MRRWIDDIGRARPKLKRVLVFWHDVDRAVLCRVGSALAACGDPISLEGWPPPFNRDTGATTLDATDCRRSAEPSLSCADGQHNATKLGRMVPWSCSLPMRRLDDTSHRDQPERSLVLIHAWRGQHVPHDDLLRPRVDDDHR